MEAAGTGSGTGDSGSPRPRDPRLRGRVPPHSARQEFTTGQFPSHFPAQQFPFHYAHAQSSSPILRLAPQAHLSTSHNISPSHLPQQSSFRAAPPSLGPIGFNQPVMGGATPPHRQAVWTPHSIVNPPIFMTRPQWPHFTNSQRPQASFHPSINLRDIIRTPYPPRAGMIPYPHPSSGDAAFLYGHSPSPVAMGVASHDPSSGNVSSQTDSVTDPFIQEWLKEVEKHKPGEDDSKRHIKIPEARSLLIKGAELLSYLHSAHRALNSLALDNETEWETLKMKVNMYKEEFLSIRSSLDVPGLKDHLARKTVRLRSKRERGKRRWAERREEWKRRVQSSEQKTEEWIKNKEQDELKAKMEKSVQASAGDVLEEVKRKKMEVRRLMELAESLKELRSIRREASRKKGDAPPIEADEKFSHTHEALVNMLSQQLDVYEREEHALRVLMEEEVMEKLQQKKDPTEHAPSRMEQYLKACESDEAMAGIRSEWNAYVSAEGSGLPTSPDLLPPSPSNPAWKQYFIGQK